MPVQIETRANTQMRRDKRKGPPSAGCVRWYTKYCCVNTPPIIVPRPISAPRRGIQRIPVATMPAPTSKEVATISSGRIRAPVARKMLSNSIAKARAAPSNAATVSLPKAASG
jgi:hypothetical protein